MSGTMNDKWIEKDFRLEEDLLDWDECVCLQKVRFWILYALGLNTVYTPNQESLERFFKESWSYEWGKCEYDFY